MSGALSKRQQARNEKALQDLVQSVPGNNVCADCQARNPAWASWNLGIFLCMRCAAIHRKLGTHVSKVKSLSMDSWSNEQVDNMRKVGNIASNKIYNPTDQKPPVPIDADEADSAMERFIRKKYISSAFTKSSNARHNTSGSSESNDIPPPLPPKTPGRFGIRSASNIFPLSSKAKRDASGVATEHSNGSGHFHFGGSSRSPTSSASRASSYPRPDSSSSGGGVRNKVSQLFGASVQYDSSANLDSKLIQLRDMGFVDEQRNTSVLKAVDGNLERAVEALVRMNSSGGRLSPHPLIAPRESSLTAPTRTLTPTTAAASGLSIPTQSQQAPSSPLAKSNNPFDMLDVVSPAPPQSSQSTGTLQNKNPYNTLNPFGFVAPQQQLQQQPGVFNQTVTNSASALNLNQAFQNMALSPPQPLFPHHTGGGPFAQQPQLQLQQQQQQQQQTLLQPSYQTPSPSVQSSAAQNYFAILPNGSGQQAYSPQPLQYNNPFLNAGGQAGTTQQQPQFQQQPQQQPQPLALNTTTAGSVFGNNPFTRSPTHIQSPKLGQIPEQTQASYFPSLPQSQTYPLPSGNPYSAALQQTTSQAPFFQQQQPLQLQPQQQQIQQQQQQINNPFMTQPAPSPQPPLRHNTASILALYNMPQIPPQGGATTAAAPTASLQNPALNAQQPSAGGGDIFGLGVGQAATTLGTAAASDSSAFPGTKNPFLSLGGNGTSSNNTSRSVLGGQRQPPPPPPAPSAGTATASSTADIFAGGRSRDSMMALGMEWTNGRHSPDAFASLSARHY